MDSDAKAVLNVRVVTSVKAQDLVLDGVAIVSVKGLTVVKGL